MSIYSNDRPRRKLPLFLTLLVLIVVGVIAAAVYHRARFESEAPKVQITPDTDALGSAPLEVRVTDAGAGLKSLTVTLGERTIASEKFDQPVAEKKVSVVLPKGTKEGPATLKVVARDASLFRGNEAVVEKRITIDLTPPTVELIADDRYINFGGVGAIVYQASADTAVSGVKIGEHFFPGFKGAIKGNPDRYFALFAHPYDAPADVRARLVATDKAGNSREMALVYELKNVKYKKSTIALSDGFLQSKVAPLLADASARQGSPKDVFVAVNKTLRKQNEDKIREVTAKASPKLLWQGAFSQLSNSKVEANFADYRTYTYQGEPVDSAYHLGYDLSVTKHYPIEAANSGTVAFAGDLGIYGNCVMLDHGFGLFTLYGHLSSIDVKVGDSVQAKQPIGKSGETGLAAGDHLHFGVYLAGVAVLPVEWWDAKWINDNIAPKLEGHTGAEIAVSQQPKTKVRRRRR
ncbi:MAG TPA: M23 family metallopeptidase [Burkholderiales bacterium]|nr:M23 family metallopeptidase [Burkholderiales bacterium]